MVNAARDRCQNVTLKLILRLGGEARPGSAVAGEVVGRDLVQELPETLDLTLGNGRFGVRLGLLLVAVRDEDSGCLENGLVGKDGRLGA